MLSPGSGGISLLLTGTGEKGQQAGGTWVGKQGTEVHHPSSIHYLLNVLGLGKWSEG